MMLDPQETINQLSITLRLAIEKDNMEMAKRIEHKINQLIKYSTNIGS